jgi:hypothetical protein
VGDHQHASIRIGDLDGLLVWIDRLGCLGEHELNPAGREPCPDGLGATFRRVCVSLHEPELPVKLD